LASKSTTIRTAAPALAPAVLLMLLAGCRSAQVAEPLTAELAGNEPTTQVEFWHTLAERPVVSNDEAAHALLLYLDGEDNADGYEARIADLKSRGILPGGFDRPAGEAVRRGDLAVAVCKILEIKGGVIMRAFGPNPRYCTRELVYMQIYPPSSPHQTFSGSDFVSLVGRVEDAQTIQGAKRLTHEDIAEAALAEPVPAPQPEQPPQPEP